MWPTQTAFRLVFAFLSRLGVKPGSVDCQASALPQNHPNETCITLIHLNRTHDPTNATNVTTNKLKTCS